MRFSTLNAACCLALLSGCAVGPDYQRPEITSPEAWRQASQAMAPASPAAQQADLADLAWWQGFGDAKLSALVQLALDNNKDLAIAANRVRQYAARSDIASSERLPQASLKGSSAREKLSEERQAPLSSRTPVNSAAYELQALVSWELDLWGRVQRTNEAFQADLLAVEENRRAITLTVVADVVSAYVQLLALDRELALIKQDLASRRETLRLVETRLRDGGSTQMDVLQARAVAEETAAAVPLKEREIAAAENALSLLLGMNPAAVARAGDLASLKPPAVPQGIPSKVLEQRPDIRMAEQVLIGANARIGVAKAEYFPTISLTAAFGYASTDLSRLLTEPASFGSAGTNLLAKLFTAGRIEASVREAEAVRAQQVDAYRKAVQTAFYEVEDALVFHRKALEREAAIQKQWQTVKAYGLLAEKRLAGGLGTRFDLLQAELQLTAVERQKTAAQRDVNLSLVRLYKTMGGGWKVAAPDLAERAPAATYGLAKN